MMQTAPFVDRSAQAGVSAIRNTLAYSTYPGRFSAKGWSVEFLKTRVLGFLGGGLALGDLDRDGDTDAVVTHFDTSARHWRTFVLENSGQGVFTDVTARSGIANSGSHISAALGDFDNDGLPDVYLAGLGGNRLYRNAGRGRFQDVTGASPVSDGGFAVSATFLDYDNDGGLDLYVSHYMDLSHNPEGSELVFPDSFPGEANRMFRNNRDGTFSDVTSRLGIGAGSLHHTSAIASDLDNDGRADLIAIHADGPPRVYRNEGSRFSDVSTMAGMAGTGVYFRSLTAGDFDRDGWMDLFLSPARLGSNLLLRNDGNGMFRRDTRSGSLMQALSSIRFGAGALDYDADGDLDLYQFHRGGGLLWANDGLGRFEFAGNLICRNGKAAASADLDGDGLPDIMYLDREGGLHVLFNASTEPGNRLGLQLEGVGDNGTGIGTKVEIRAGAMYQKLEIRGHNGYLSQDSAILAVGLGASGQADSVTVHWPGGTVQTEANIPAGALARIREEVPSGKCCAPRER